MKKIKKNLVFFMAIMLLASCKKEENKPITPQQLIVGKWRLTASSISNQGIVVDSYSTLAACKKDNTYEFLANSSYTLDEATSKCNPNDPQQFTGNWAMNDTGTNIVVSGTGVAYSAEINEINASTLKTKILNGSGFGIDLSYTYTKIQ